MTGKTQQQWFWLPVSLSLITAIRFSFSVGPEICVDVTYRFVSILLICFSVHCLLMWLLGCLCVYFCVIQVYFPSLASFGCPVQFIQCCTLGGGAGWESWQNVATLCCDWIPFKNLLAPPCVTHCFQDDHRRESSRLACVTDRKWL